MPSDLTTGSTDEIEEERRLLYVAMTRAKDGLHLLTPQRFYVHQQARTGDGHVYAARTRFIPDNILDRFALIAWPARTANNGADARRVAPSIDLACAGAQPLDQVRARIDW